MQEWKEMEISILLGIGGARVLVAVLQVPGQKW